MSILSAPVKRDYASDNRSPQKIHIESTSARFRSYTCTSKIIYSMSCNHVYIAAACNSLRSINNCYSSYYIFKLQLLITYK